MPIKTKTFTIGRVDKNAIKNQHFHRWYRWPKKVKKKCQTSIEKAYLAFGCLKVYVLNEMFWPFTTGSKAFLTNIKF